MSPSKSDGRRNIVERMVRPNTEVMKGGGNRNLFQVRRAVGRQGHADVHDPIGVIPVRGKVTAEFGSMVIQHLVENRDLSNQIHLYTDAGIRFVNRVTNSSAFWATSRQPASIVSACPRRGILMISVTPSLRFCFL